MQRNFVIDSYGVLKLRYTSVILQGKIHILTLYYEENFVIICTGKLQSAIHVLVLFRVKFVYEYKYEGLQSLQSFSAS